MKDLAVRLVEGLVDLEDLLLRLVFDLADFGVLLTFFLSALVFLGVLDFVKVLLALLDVVLTGISLLPLRCLSIDVDLVLKGDSSTLALE